MIRTSSVLFWFGLIIVASLALYRTSDRVHELTSQLRDLNASIEDEQKSIHVLKAEWVYLANPARIETAAKKHLALRPTSPQQVAQIDALSEVMPTRSEAMASVAITGTPIANIKTTLPPHPVTVATRHKAVMTVAAADTGHINDHMMMERTASAQPAPDSIGALLSELTPQ
jgi:cell division protein FtsL